MENNNKFDQYTSVISGADKKISVKEELLKCLLLGQFVRTVCCKEELFDGLSHSAIRAPSMEVSACSSAGVWPCPFRGFHCCPDGMAGSKGFPRLVAHIKRLHLSSDDRRGALREALSTDCELFVSVGEALKALDQWVCGVCMCLHALSRACHHSDGMTRFKWVAGDVEEFIVGIVRPQVRREVVPLGGVVVDEVLLDRVFSLPITTVKSIPHSCRMAFSHALAAALGLLTVRSAGLVTGSLCNAIVFNGRWHLGVGMGLLNLFIAFCPTFEGGIGIGDQWVAPFGTDTLTALLAKHPILPPPVMPGSLPSEPPLVVDVDTFLGWISNLPKTWTFEMSKYLGDFQFGVGVPSGAEAVLHGANRFLNKFHSDGSLAMLTVDFSNAFNLVDRTTLLQELSSSRGNPLLGPLLFALVLHPLVHRIRDCCQLLFHAWYLDDGTIIGDTKEVAKAIDIIRAEGPRLGLELNIKKKFLAIMQWGGRRAIEAIVVCGGPFFGDFQWRLASLPIRFGGLGLCSAEDVSTYAFVASRAQSWSLQDHILKGCGIDGADSDYGYALDRVRIEIVKSLGVSFDLSPRQKAVVECLRAPRAQNFLTVIPIEGLGQHMSALEYRTILKYRLMIPLFPVDEPCPVCRKVCLDSFGEHAVHCKELPGFKYRHDLVRDVLYDVLKRAGISSRKEAPVNFLTDPLEGRSTLRPADILVFGWAGGKHACVDLTGVSPLVGLRDNGFVAGQAALKAESSKVAKHEKACLENQHVFIPFAFDTFGFLAPEADEFLNRVQRVVQSNFSTPKTQNFIFSRIGFAI
ncbi:hypothetical protein Tco_0099722 [Tanacetum coccineum]